MLFSFFLWRDYHEFLDDLEQDPQLRQNVNIFKDSTKPIPVDINDGMDPSEPRITLEEMLDDLVLEDDAMGDEWLFQVIQTLFSYEIIVDKSIDFIKFNQKT